MFTFHQQERSECTMKEYWNVSHEVTNELKEQEKETTNTFESS
jgi:hypothetical protein